MYDACSNKNPDFEIKTSNPLTETKWLNCYANYTEPRKCENKTEIDLIKKLCPTLYEEDLPVCCSYNQLRILENDLNEAKTIIGSCSSCYLNFRTMWCFMACHPNQSDFLHAKKIESKPYLNFTHALNEYHLSQLTPATWDDNEGEGEEEGGGEKSANHDDVKKQDEHQENGSVESNPEVVAGDEVVAVPPVHNEKRKRRNNGVTSYVDVITDIDYYLGEKFINGLIDSCRDVKLYQSDALEGFCGVSSKLCTPRLYGDHLGLTVPQRPLDIHFKYLNETTVAYDTDKNNNIQLTFKAINPMFFRCNENYNFPNIEFGARCSCKACSDSCALKQSDFKLIVKEPFRIGHYDGAFVLMMLIFLCFSVAFLTLITYSKKRSRKNYNTDGINIGTDSTDDAKTRLKGNQLVKKTSDAYFLDKLQYFGEQFESMIEYRFLLLGRFCSTYPKLVLIIGLAFCSLMCLGYIHFKVEQDPVELWSSESSIARQNKKYFDENFGPFYRITQLIIVPKENESIDYSKLNYFDSNYVQKNYSYTLSSSVLTEVYKLYEKLNNISIYCPKCNNLKGARVTYNDICYKPMYPENKNCALQSIFQYWQNNKALIEESLRNNTHIEKLITCMKNTMTIECLSLFGAPIQPFLVVGGLNKRENLDVDTYMNANAIVITFVVNNFNKNLPTSADNLEKALTWEAEALKILKNYTSDTIQVSFTTERSIEDEIERQSKADIKIIVISYLAMFLYLTLTLGKYSSLQMKVMLLETKVFLGLTGVVLVLLSVFSSGGFFTYIGVPATLITLEVIPFLLLAVGVDNIYIMVQTYQNDERNPNESVEDQISRVVGKVGPSMLLSGVTQSVAFLISAMTPMPGVRAFSLYASLAIILNFFMQITCFVVLLTLDAKREKSKRLDVFCFVKLAFDENDLDHTGKKSFLYRFFRQGYTPFILHRYVRPFVILIFVGFFCVSISMCNKLRVGFDQQLAMPVDSYQIKYFEALQKHLAVGPPVYFVLKDNYNYDNEQQLGKLCGAPNCSINSLQSILSSASLYPNETFIAQPSVNWIDDYVEWLNDKQCCLFKTANPKEYCDSNVVKHFETQCSKCPANYTKELNFPTKFTLNKYIKYFLKQNPSMSCIKGGHAMYGDAVRLIMKRNEFDYENTDVDFTEIERIGPTHFMAYHTVLSTSNDFVNAMVSAHKLADRITAMLNEGNNSTNRYEVFPYSVFYVFYEQYLTIWKDATVQLLLTLAAIFICTFILLSFDLFTSVIITFLIAIIIIDMVGIMYLWNIELNAVSLVNLVIAIGISVEFSAHIARAFATSSGVTRKDRAAEALYSMGPPVFSGILQSIVGISVLAFANSQLFQVFYFRMYFSVLVLGLTHGLIFLPVLLSFIGRHSNHLTYLQLDVNGVEQLKSNDDDDNTTTGNQSNNSQELQFNTNNKINVDYHNGNKNIHNNKNGDYIHLMEMNVNEKSNECFQKNTKAEKITNIDHNGGHQNNHSNSDNKENELKQIVEKELKPYMQQALNNSSQKKRHQSLNTTPVTTITLHHHNSIKKHEDQEEELNLLENEDTNNHATRNNNKRIFRNSHNSNHKNFIIDDREIASDYNDDDDDDDDVYNKNNLSHTNEMLDYNDDIDNLNDFKDNILSKSLTNNNNTPVVRKDRNNKINNNNNSLSLKVTRNRTKSASSTAEKKN